MCEGEVPIAVGGRSGSPMVGRDIGIVCNHESGAAHGGQSGKRGGEFGIRYMQIGGDVGVKEGGG